MLVIFDWDGTLANSTDHIVAAMLATIRDMQLLPRTPDHCRAQIGLGLRETARSLYPDMNDTEVDGFREHYSRNYLALGQGEYQLSLYDGALQTLSELRQSGCELAVATGKSRAGLNRVLKELQLADWFVATRASDETASKPDPLMLYELLEETGYMAEQAVMIGDSSYDLAMAKAIDMPRIGVSYGVHDEATLADYEPVAIVDDVIALPDCIQRLV